MKKTYKVKDLVYVVDTTVTVPDYSVTYKILEVYDEKLMLDVGCGMSIMVNKSSVLSPEMFNKYIAWKNECNKYRIKIKEIEKEIELLLK